MPIYSIPKEIKRFVIVEAVDGSLAVADDGTPPGRVVFIPCRDASQAADVKATLDADDHDGTVQVDLFTLSDAEGRP